MREREMSMEDPAAAHNGANGQGGADGRNVKWSTPGTKKAAAAQRIGIGRPR